VGAGALLAVIVLLVSPHVGRADPTGNYRPLLPADALATDCFPLPGGVDLDVAYQVRRDGDVVTDRGPRRRLHAQVDLVDAPTARQRVVAAFARAGFRTTGRPGPDGTVRLVDAAGAEVRVTVTAIPGTGPGTLVRSDLLLDLPPSPAPRADPVCYDPKATKRWPS
jgi:hypothetical protein